MSSSDERLAKKTARRVYSWMFALSHENGAYVPRDFPRHTRCVGSGGCRLPGNRNLAGPPTLSAPWAPRASQRGADAHPCNRRRHTDCGLRIRHGRILLELDAGAASGGAVQSRGKLRPRRTRLERSAARAAHGPADRPGATHAAGCNRCARAVRSRWALVRRLCKSGVRAPISQ